MWSDGVTNVDFVNFTSVAESVAEVIDQADGRPVSIGVSGAWGVGKSSMITLIRGALEKRDYDSKFVFVEFNAWLYQGFDDVRAALLEVIATKLKEEAEERKSGVDKAKELLNRVDWFRLAKLTAGSAFALSLGLPPVGLLGTAVAQGRKLASGKAGAEDVEGAQATAEAVLNEGGQLLKAPKDESPPQAIHAVRESFEGVLDALGITLVVLIDDLDRCLPETTISTLEAIRLFLFLDRTAFVIAADNEMIRHAVKRHFDGVDDAHVTSYFDKLIQVPIGVPPLGTQEVRAYLILLFVEASELAAEVQDTVRDSVLEQLSKSWQGKRVDRAFMQTLDIEYPAPLIARFDAADRLAPLMTTAEGIKGNPRLIKRFLNALSIRMSLARAQGVDVDEAVLTKLLLFERCGEPKAYAALSEAIASSDDGAPSLLAEWEEHAAQGTDYELPEPWDAPFTRAWLALSPQLATKDLRGALYVSREHAPLVTPEDRLSSEAAEVLGALLEHPDMANDLATRVEALQHAERAVILDRLLERARQVTEWGVPPVLDACIVVTRPDLPLAKRLSAFLSERPKAQLTPAIVQKISNEPWAKGVYAGWIGTDVSKPVKKAIERLESNGNVSVK